jgi:synaptobrevin family protein YKT6
MFPLNRIDHECLFFDQLILTAAHELSSFSYFTRGSVQEMCTFCARTFVSRTPRGNRQTVDYQGNSCHIYVRADGLAGCAIADKDYPDRVAHTLLHKLLTEFETEHPQWASYKTDNCADDRFEWATNALAQYQDPASADSIMKVQRELDLTKEFMHKNIEAMLDRGEKIDSLLEKSNDLNAQSKMFAKQASKMNSCCLIA